MKCVCLSRKECLGIVHLICGVLSIPIIVVMIGAQKLGDDLNIICYICAASGLVFVDLFSGFAAFVVHTKNTVTNTFIRLHNVVVLAALVIFLEVSRSMVFETYRPKYFKDIFTNDTLVDLNDSIDFSFPFSQAIIILNGVSVLIQGYLVYTRFIVMFYRRKGKPPAAND